MAKLMGCNDSRRSVLGEEEMIVAEEEKILEATVTPQQVAAVVNKYSRGHIITDSQLVRILEVLGKKGRDPALAKQHYFGGSYFHAEPTGYDKTRLGILFLLLSSGSLSSKTHQMSLITSRTDFSPVDIEHFLRIIISISVIYTPLLVSTDTLRLQTYVSALHRCADTITRSITAEITQNDSNLPLNTLISRLNSSQYSRIWTCSGARRLISESEGEEMHRKEENRVILLGKVRKF